MRHAIAIAVAATQCAARPPAAEIADAPSKHDVAEGRWFAAGGEWWRLRSTHRAGSMPWSATLSADGRNLWVAMVGLRDRDNVWRYDTRTMEVMAKSRFPGHAVEAVVAAEGARVVVSNSRKHELVELDADALTVERRLATGKVPKHFVASPDGARYYVANWGSGSVSIVDADSGHAVDHVRTGRHARGVALAPDGKTLYVTNFGAGSVAVVDIESRTVIDKIRVCKNPRHPVVSGELLIVTCFGARHLAVIERESGAVVRKVTVGRGAKTIALSHDGATAFVANERSNSLSVIELADWSVVTVPLPARKPCGVAIAPDGERVYVTARGSDEVLVFERWPGTRVDARAEPDITSDRAADARDRARASD